MKPSFWATWKFKLIAGVVILAALAIGLFAAHQIGYNKGKNISAVEIAKYEGDIEKLRGDLVIAQGKVTVKYVTKYVKDVAYVDRVEYVNRDVIRNVIVSRDVNVNKGFVYVWNQTTQALPVIDFDLARDATPSHINDNVLLENYNENMAIAHRQKKNLEALQGWVKETYEKSKKVADENQ